MGTTRYIAQNVLTGEILDMDVPLTVDSEQPRWELSGAGTLTGTIKGDHPWLSKAGGVLVEWQTALYYERDGVILGGWLVQSSRIEGADWQVQAYAWTTYANGIPYLGKYDKIIGKDPGVIWAKLWQHVQSQPDGNLGLKFVMPSQLGPNIGTKDEPYELSWWEAKDVGSELQALASEAPFDYVESHRWAVPEHETVVRTSFRIGGGNLHGAKKGKDRDHWVRDHLNDQCDLIGSMGVDIFIAVELNDDVLSGMPDGAHQAFAARMRERVSPHWQISARDNGGNQALYRSDVVTFVSVAVREGVDDPSVGGSDNLRSASVWTFRDNKTGRQVKVGGYHLHSDDPDGKSRRGSRLAEARDVDQLVGADSDVIAFGDWNSYSMGSDEVYGIIEAETGLVPMNKRTKPLNADLNSYGKKPKRKGRWIDNILSNSKYWNLDEAAGVPTRGESDHALWMRGVFTPTTPGGTVSIAAAEESLSKKILHTVELCYPRAGSRRADLRFALGENVIDVIPFERDGEEYANNVVTLGKGEGSKTLRGDDGVRDGRLRRVTVYTDKLAGSKDRCVSLAKRERAWRSLKPRVDSILVSDHDHAPIGSWALGDDILLEAYDVPHLGEVVDWYRIMAWAMVTETTARLTLTRSDAFTYGVLVPPPSDDLPDEDVEISDD